MSIRKRICALLVPVLILTGCNGVDIKEADGTSEAGNTAADQSTAGSMADPSEVVNAVTEQIPISSMVEKGTDELTTYFGALDTSEVESGAYCLCGSGALPDAAAVIKFKTDEAAKAAEEALQKKLDYQIEVFTSYTPDEMYKLETAKVYSYGNYAVYLALSDNEAAKSIVDEKLKG